MSLVSLLIELNLELEAMKALSKVLENPLNLTRNSLFLSENARRSVIEQLLITPSKVQKQKYDISNLIIAIFAFGTPNHFKNDKQYTLLLTIEDELMSTILTMKIQDILILLNSYCIFHRYPPGKC